MLKFKFQRQDVKLPNDWLLEQESPPTKRVFDEIDLTHIQQYLDGTIKISFQNNPPLRINEGRHSFAFARSESISKRDQENNDFLKKNLEKSFDFLKKNLEKPSDLKLKGVSSSNSQVSTPFYSTKAKSSSPCGNVVIDDEEDSVSITPSDFDSPSIEILLFTKIN